MVPAVVNFNAYFGCQKCCVCGQYFNQFRVMSFPRTACIKRTNQSFRQRNQPEHHREYRSILEELDIDMVADFPTSDPLHLIELGIMKRCLTRWKDGTKSYKHKFNKAYLNRINSLLIRANAEMPFEIHRAVRDLNSLHYWKGTEFRTFLLYVGIIVLKDVLIAEEYSHFKLLVCAVIYCSSEHYKRAVNNSIIVDELIGDYIEQYIEIYGEHTISSNIHNLAHLLNDVRRFGGLNSISTYSFENCLRVMKLKLRAMNKPMEQIARRMSEISALMDYEREMESIAENDSEIKLKSPIKGDSMKFQQVFLESYRLSSLQFGNKWFMDKEKRIIEFKYAKKVAENIFLYGLEVTNKTDFFIRPVLSSKLNIYAADILNYEQNVEIVCKIENIKCKMVCLSAGSQYVFQPLLHTLS